MAMPCHRAWGNSRTLGVLRWERGKERVFRSEHFKPSIAHTRSVSSLLVKERAEVSGDSSQVSSSLLTLRFLNERNFWTLYWGCELTVKDSLTQYFKRDSQRHKEETWYRNQRENFEILLGRTALNTGRWPEREGRVHTLHYTSSSFPPGPLIQVIEDNTQ